MTNGIGPQLGSTKRVTRASLTPTLSEAEPFASRWQWEIVDTPPPTPGTYRRPALRRKAPRRVT